MKTGGQKNYAFIDSQNLNKKSTP